MKKKWIIYSLIIVILLSIFLYFYFMSNKISATKVTKENYTEKILVTGTIQAKNFSLLTSGINGTIENIYIREGEAIKKGDIIAKLDTQEIEADINQAKALYEKAKFDLATVNTVNFESAKSQLSSSQINYNIAKNEFLDYQDLFKKKYISKLDYDLKKQAFINAENTLKNAQLNLKTLETGGSTNKSFLESVKSAENALISLQKNLSKYYIYAPYDGFITTRNVEVGQTVAPYTNMFEVSSNNEKVVSIDLDEKYTNRIHLGSPIKIYPYADTSKFSLGKLYYTSNNVDNTAGTLEIRGNIETILPEFLFNSTVNSIIEGQTFKNSILLQGVYIIQKKNKTYVYILKNNKSKLVEIEGTSVIDGFIVTKGLENGDVVLSPKNITDNIRVTPSFDS